MNEAFINAYFFRVDAATPYKGYMGQIENSFTALKSYIGGRITSYDFTNEIVVVAEEDAAILGRRLNRALFGSDGGRIAVFAGNLLFVRHEEDRFTSLQDGDVVLIEERFKPIERIFGDKVFLKSVDELPEKWW